MIMEVIILALTLSLDAFAASFGYGCQKIKIPLLSGIVIILICTGITGISFFLGSMVDISQNIAGWVSFVILLTIGLIKLLDSITKSIIRKYINADAKKAATSLSEGREIHSLRDGGGLGAAPPFKKQIKLSLFNIKFILQVYADPETADVDVSESLSTREATMLAIALSLDGLAVGFAIGLMGLSNWFIAVFLLFSLFFNSFAVLMGSWFGKKVSEHLKFNMSWVAGVILIILAITSLFS